MNEDWETIRGADEGKLGGRGSRAGIMTVNYLRAGAVATHVCFDLGVLCSRGNYSP